MHYSKLHSSQCLQVLESMVTKKNFYYHGYRNICTIAVLSLIKIVIIIHTSFTISIIIIITIYSCNRNYALFIRDYSKLILYENIQVSQQQNDMFCQQCTNKQTNKNNKNNNNNNRITPLACMKAHTHLTSPWSSQMGST